MTVKLGNTPVFPAAAHMALAIEALRQVREDQKLPFDGVTLREIAIKTALVIPETDDGIEIQLCLQPLVIASEELIWFMFSVESILNGQWTLHCEGRIAANHSVEKTERDYRSPVKTAKLTHRVSSSLKVSGPILIITRPQQMSRSWMKVALSKENHGISCIPRLSTLVCS